jgi:hypothetical protein
MLDIMGHSPINRASSLFVLGTKLIFNLCGWLSRETGRGLMRSRDHAHALPRRRA